MPRPKTVYRGESRPAWIITLAVSVLAALILFVVWLFYHMQQYMVYDKDGARLVLPSERAETQDGPSGETGGTAGVPPIDVEIVVDKADYSAVEGTDAGSLRAIHARFVAAENVTEAALGGYAADMGAYDALVLELKPASGFLGYTSSLPLTDSYAVNGAAELAERVEQLKGKGVYLAAQLSSLADSAMAARNTPAAMKNAVSGGVYLKDGQAFLDPYSDVTRAYLAGLLAELAGLGFDEVLLTGLYLPEDENLRYSGEMSAQPDAESAVSSLALYLRGQADALGLRLSAAAEREGAGQDLAVFFKAFDRVAYDAADAETRAALESALGADGGARIVPVAAGYVPERESYIVK